jgi:hypothetical protein
LKYELPALKVKNAKTAKDNGVAMTDLIATWVKKGYVARPFDQLPCKGFRANPLMVAVQKNKVRPIMNLSTKKGLSFNDAVEENETDLLIMSLPKRFAESLVAAGKGALFAKEDIQDAYKLIPNPIVPWNSYASNGCGNIFLTLPI